MTSIFVNFLVSIGGSSWETWATGGSGAAAQMDELLSCSEGGQKWKNEGIIGEDDSDEGVEDPPLQHYQRWVSYCCFKSTL